MMIWFIVAFLYFAGLCAASFFLTRKYSFSFHYTFLENLGTIIIFILAIGVVPASQMAFSPGPRDQYSTWWMFFGAFWPAWSILFSPLGFTVLYLPWFTGTKRQNRLMIVALGCVLGAAAMQIILVSGMRFSGILLIESVAFALLLGASIIIKYNHTIDPQVIDSTGA